ncbi:MAG TPA: hypothetical protein VEZ41_03180 [Allosphingosinicella sp.]|nr:hypothetical protein [Allosphingosinicella sp.]
MPYSNKRSHVLGCVILVVVVVAAFLLLGAWFSGGPYTTALPRPFNSERSKAADTDGDIRCSMIADLKYRIGVVGKSRAEIQELLGDADDRDADPASSYWLLCPSFLDVYILEVWWDGDRAAAAQVRDT